MGMNEGRSSKAMYIGRANKQNLNGIKTGQKKFSSLLNSLNMETQDADELVQAQVTCQLLFDFDFLTSKIDMTCYML